MIYIYIYIYINTHVHIYTVHVCVCVCQPKLAILHEKYKATFEVLLLLMIRTYECEHAALDRLNALRQNKHISLKSLVGSSASLHVCLMRPRPPPRVFPNILPRTGDVPRHQPLRSGLLVGRRAARLDINRGNRLPLHRPPSLPPKCLHPLSPPRRRYKSTLLKRLSGPRRLRGVLECEEKTRPRRNPQHITINIIINLNCEFPARDAIAAVMKTSWR